MGRGRGAAGKNAGLVLILLLAGLLPFALSGFRLFQFTQVYIYAIALLGLNILTGYNGQISLGHSAFYAIGAYTTAIMIVIKPLEASSPAGLSTVPSELATLFRKCSGFQPISWDFLMACTANF